MKRTINQNRALHLYFDQLAEALNDAGYDYQVVYEMTGGKLDTDWSKELVKEKLWKPVQEALTGEDSTADVETVDYHEVYKRLDKRISELTGVHVEWPSQEILQQEGL